MPVSDGNISGEETHSASLASDGAGVTTPSLDCPFSSQTQVKARCSTASLQPTTELAQPENCFTNVKKPNVTTKSTNIRDPVLIHQEPPFCVVPTLCPDAVHQAGVDALGDLPHKNHTSQEESQKTTLEPAMERGRGQQVAGVYKYLSRAGSWSGSASLPRGYRRSEGSSRLSSAVTARPFGTKQARVSSLPRLCNVSSLISRLHFYCVETIWLNYIQSLLCGTFYLFLNLLVFWSGLQNRSGVDSNDVLRQLSTVLLIKHY